MRRRIKPLLAFAAGLAVVALAAGCGSSSGGGGATHPDYKTALAGAPAPLAKLYSEGNKLLPGGKDAFEKRVASLGYPVVANVWASWCGPCRYEFGLFQNVSPKWGKKVAFLGIDAEDSKSAAEEWLSENPVPYPTYFETGAEIAASLKLRGRPDTAFYNRKGELVHLKIGQYSHDSELEEDIRRYALGGA
jgi:cytochrome c biogenesis protein CcmG, thiol:disulfide interchange protein DsbE